MYIYIYMNFYITLPIVNCLLPIAYLLSSNGRNIFAHMLRTAMNSGTLVQTQITRTH